MGERAEKYKKHFIELFSGDIILHKKFDRQLGLVFYIFALICVIISWSLYVERQLVKVENNAKEIEALEVSYHQRSIELVGLDQRTKIEKMLEECHSTLRAPTEPARMIERN